MLDIMPGKRTSHDEEGSQGVPEAPETGQSAPAWHQLAWAVILAAILACVAECSLLNYPFWTTVVHGDNPISLPSEVTGEDGAKLDNLSLYSVGFDVQKDDGAIANVTLSLRDSGHSKEWYDLPSLTVYKSGTYRVSVWPYGYAKGLKVQAKTNSDSPCEIRNVTVNQVIPFEFSKRRALFVFLIVLLWMLLRPKSPLWRMSYDSSRKWAEGAFIGALMVACVATSVTFAGPTDDGARVFAFDEYNELARAFSRGELYIAEEVPSWMAELDDLDSPTRLTGESNIQDPSVRAEKAEQTGEPYKYDAAYYHGHYYVYFGVVPVLLTYYPYYLLTGQDFPSSMACLIALYATVVGILVLCWDIYRMFYKTRPINTFLVGATGCLLASSVVYSASRPSTYNVPVLFALAFGIWGGILALRGMRASSAGRRVAYVAGASLLVALIAGCRPQLLICILPLAYALLRMIRQEEVTSSKVALLAAFAVPMAMVASGIMWYNAVRFGSPFDFGANYNLPGNNDMTLRGHHIVRALEGLFYLMLRTPNITTAFPFMHVVPMGITYMGITIREPVPCGLLMAVPCCLLTLVAIPFSSCKRKVKVVLATLLAFATIIAMFDAEGAGILGRYIQDFGIFVGLAFAIAMFAVPEATESRLARGTMASLVMVSIVLSLMLRCCLMTWEAFPSGGIASNDLLALLQGLSMPWVY